MSNQQPIGNYVIISPVKDEERYIETTIHAILKQTLRPKKWVIVDDGSQDRTSEILEIYAEQYNWIHIMRINRSAVRKLGSAEIRAFEAGRELVRDEEFDFIVKLDADLDLPADYFEKILARFREDERLGIASGAVLEKLGRKWHETKLPKYHAAGASKVVRAQCFSEIGGFPLFPGWDTVDEIKAQSRGWRTCHFGDICFYHLRPEGSAIGYIRTATLHGEVYYVSGGGKMFFGLKVLNYAIFGKPIILGAVMLVYGYFRAWLKGKKRLVTQSEADFYRRQLNERITNRIHEFLSGSKPDAKVLDYTR
jgi:biofilm PGA synthesis N-glycosyltransferase PgaC